MLFIFGPARSVRRVLAAALAFAALAFSVFGLVAAALAFTALAFSVFGFVAAALAFTALAFSVFGFVAAALAFAALAFMRTGQLHVTAADFGKAERVCSGIGCTHCQGAGEGGTDCCSDRFHMSFLGHVSTSPVVCEFV